MEPKHRVSSNCFRDRLIVRITPNRPMFNPFPHCSSFHTFVDGLYARIPLTLASGRDPSLFPLETCDANPANSMFVNSPGARRTFEQALACAYSEAETSYGG